MAYGRTDSIFRYLGAAIGTTMSIPHSAGAVGARAGRLDDLFCGMLRVVSGCCRLARRAGSPLMPPLCARRRSAPDWPFMSNIGPPISARVNTRGTN